RPAHMSHGAGPAQPVPPAARKPARGDVLELALEEIDERGRARGRAGEYTVAVRGAVAGARVRVQVLKRRGHSIEGVLEAEVASSPDAVAARCPHATSCGGCSFQELAYPAQLAAKERLLARILASLGPLPLAPVIGCDSPWHYRNKMDFTFGSERWIEPGEP